MMLVTGSLAGVKCECNQRLGTFEFTLSLYGECDGVMSNCTSSFQAAQDEFENSFWSCNATATGLLYVPQCIPV